MPSMVLGSPRSMSVSLSSPPSKLFIILSLSLSLVRGDIALSGLSLSTMACGLPSLTLPAPLRDLLFRLRLELLSDLSVRLLIVSFPLNPCEKSSVSGRGLPALRGSVDDAAAILARAASLVMRVGCVTKRVASGVSCSGSSYLSRPSMATSILVLGTHLSSGAAVVVWARRSSFCSATFAGACACGSVFS